MLCCREVFNTSNKTKIIGILLLFLSIALRFVFAPSAHAQDTYGLLFDGSNDYVDVSNIPAVGNGSVTIEAWVKPESFGNWNYVFTYGKTGDNALISIVINSSGNIVSYVEADATEQISTPSDGSALTLNQWNHVAIVLDRTNNTLTRYLNGQPTGTQTSTSLIGSASISSQGSAFIAGANNKVTNEHLDGGIDEVRVWTTARTQSQIQTNMTSEIVSESSLIARWGFSEGSGLTISDTSGNSITGTISGATWITGYDFNTNALVTVTTNPVTELKQTTATLNGNIDSLGQESSVNVYFKYGTDSQNLNNTTNTSTVSSIGPFNTNITNLVPGTTYYYQAYATNGNFTQSGSVMSFGVNSLNFDASDNVKVGDMSSIESSQYLTIEAYAKGYDFTNSIIASKHSTLTNGSFYLAYLDANTIRFTVITNVGRYNYDVTQALDNNWHHIAGVYDSVAQTVKIYYDGVQIGATGTYSGTIKPNTIQFIIGNYNVNDWAWVGQIDEVRVWNVARTAEQISANKDTEIETATGLVARWSFNEGAGTSVYDSTGNGNNGTISGAEWISGRSFNVAPTYTLITHPSNNSTSVTLSPQFTIQPSDPENQNLTVKLYGRLKQVSESDFTIVVLPDTQYYSASYPSIFSSQSTWITNNVNNLNIKMVLHEGDIVDTGTNTTQWNNAMSALNILSQNNIPNIISIGNHDYNTVSSRLTTNFNKYINFNNWYSSKSWFNGACFEDGKSENVYTKMTIGSKKYLFMTLEFGPRNEVLDWAKNVIEAHPDYTTIIVTHNYMYSDDTRVGTGDSWNPHSYISSNVNDGDEIWENLTSLYPNILIVFSGHILNDGLGRLTSTGLEGNLVYQMLANYQMNSMGGNGYLRYLTFKPSEDKINVYTYSPYLNQYNTSADNQFSYDYDFLTTDNYSLIDTKTNVVSGNNVSLDWPNLESNQEYEWYINVSDGQNSVSTSTSSFATDNRPSVSISDPGTNWLSGNVSISYTLSDSDSNLLNILQTSESGIEYSLDGNEWNDATEFSTGSDGLTNLNKNTTYNFVWNTSIDLADVEDETVYIRIRPNDGELSAPTWTISNPFKIDNAGPENVGQITISDITTNSATINKPTSVTDNASGASQWKITNNSYQSDFVSVDTESISVDGLLENTAYTYAAVFKDAKGNISSAGPTNTFYTKLSTPTNISASSITQNQIKITVDSFRNDDLLDSGYFFERAGDNSSWINLNSWTSSGLNCGSSYTFYVKYRNSEGTETTYTSITTSTLPCTSQISNSSSNSSSSDSTNSNTTSSSTSISQLATPNSSLTNKKKDNNIFYVIPNNIESKKLEVDVPFFESSATGIALKVNEDSNTLSLFTGQDLKISVKPKKATKDVVVELSLQQLVESKSSSTKISFVKDVYAQEVFVEKTTLNDENNDGIYEGSVKISGIPGEYIVKTIINYKDGTNKEISNNASVQSTGYIYQKMSNKELRISNAQVTLLEYNDQKETYEAWNAKNYHQKNPIITSQSGEFIFFVPNGKYMLEIKADGYKDYKSDEIIIDGNNYINEKVEVYPTTKNNFSNKYLFIIGFIIFVFAVIYTKKAYKTKRKLHKIRIN